MTGRSAGPRVVLVAAVADNGVIGRDGDLPWHLPEDLRHFKATTRGQVLLMGRRTFESIGRPLPERTTVVLTRDPDWSADGVHVVRSVEEAIEVARDRGVDLMVGGGTAVYEAALPHATSQLLTEVHQSPEGDTSYPDVDRSVWQETWREPRDGFDWVRWERRST
ncbi:MAG TPA: dihydrofolate reductase [Nocardioidaceae bacterium]|nr:dihydrofolate reductase [Nocardioidaceae bacterium]